MSKIHLFKKKTIRLNHKVLLKTSLYVVFKRQQNESDLMKLKIKEWVILYQANTNKKKTGIRDLVPGNAEIKATMLGEKRKAIYNDKEGGIHNGDLIMTVMLQSTEH